MKTYIIHVSDAFEREKHIKKELDKTELDIEFVNEGDKADLSEIVLRKYFLGEMTNISNANRISCAYKHILTYEKIVNDNHQCALVLEDDIMLYRNFNKQIHHIENEIKNLNLTNYIISLEDSNLKYVKGSERLKNKFIYPKLKGRFTGAYLIDIVASQNILSYLKGNKCSLSIDWFHNLCSEKKVIQIYWCHPPVATQGTLNGKMKSLIDDNRVGISRKISYKIQKIYKRLLFKLR